MVQLHRACNSISGENSDDDIFKSQRFLWSSMRIVCCSITFQKRDEENDDGPIRIRTSLEGWHASYHQKKSAVFDLSMTK